MGKEKESQSIKPKIGDFVYCKHGEIAYQAKVLDTRKENGETEFFVHYQGWSKKWDEWANEGRVQPFLPEESNAKQSSSKGKQSTSAKKKTTIEPINLEQPVEISQANQDIKIPDELRDWLIDDDNCIKNKKLSVLPASSTISMILKDFINHKKIGTKNPGEKEAIINELTLGIKDYFNVMLGSHLLYKFERLQYQNLLREEGKDADLTNHYGVIHLIRLMTKIGKPLASTNLDSQNIQTIVNYIQELMKFISKQSNLFDIERNYTLAPPEYIKNALK